MQPTLSLLPRILLVALSEPEVLLLITRDGDVVAVCIHLNQLQVAAITLRRQNRTRAVDWPGYVPLRFPPHTLVQSADVCAS